MLITEVFIRPGERDSFFDHPGKVVAYFKRLYLMRVGLIVSPCRRL